MAKKTKKIVCDFEDEKPLKLVKKKKRFKEPKPAVTPAPVYDYDKDFKFGAAIAIAGVIVFLFLFALSTTDSTVSVKQKLSNVPINTVKEVVVEPAKEVVTEEVKTEKPVEEIKVEEPYVTKPANTEYFPPKEKEEINVDVEAQKALEELEKQGIPVLDLDTKDVVITKSVPVQKKKVAVKKQKEEKPKTVIIDLVKDNDSLKARCLQKRKNTVSDRIERSLNNCI